MNGQVIDFNFEVAQALGLDTEVIREARPLVYEISLRISEVFKDVAATEDPSREAMALAQSMAAAVIIEAAGSFINEDLETFYFRLLEAADRGLFDMSPTEAPPKLQAIFQQYMEEEDEN
tara:strand:- start:74 stop:433 length:360 start_codon:yes stop_codon:yes gene_type:complete